MIETKAVLKVLKQMLASVGVALLACAAWVFIILFFSPGFGDESPDSVWLKPVMWWDGFLTRSGLALSVRSLQPTLGTSGYRILGVLALFAPFIALFSSVSFAALRLFNRGRSRKSPV
jgi:ABC-type Na+ efflux pump permease subunit